MQERYYPDNIIAIATAEQNGAIGIIRLSGLRVKEILGHLFVDKQGQKKDLKPWHMHFGRLMGSCGELVDHCLALYMPGPKSYTGEDVCELHCHGNLVLLKKIIREFLSLESKWEIRAAAPGEFTKRAYLNGKMDLTQAEAIHELITSESEAAFKLSLSNMDGRLNQLIDDIRIDLTEMLSLVEASFEFPEEDIQTYNVQDLITKQSDIVDRLKSLETAFQTSKLYDKGVSVAIIGEPNVGKSSLLNALLVEERAIVTAVPGTTRDVVEGSRLIHGLRFVFRDTAGLRDSQDEIEKTGMEKTAQWIEKSDIVFWVCELGHDLIAHQKTFFRRNAHKIIKILNKVDETLWQGKTISNLETEELGKVKQEGNYKALISAKTGFGLDALQAELKEWTDKHLNKTNGVHVNERQYKKIMAALLLSDEINNMLTAQNISEELLATQMREMIAHLEEITGLISSEDVLTEIFSKFCIGK
ncbi:MAG: tRNA uridine-5-carboxymethylaminomethyl(34) synthesis GTPase MnmE [bacterium]